MIQFSAFYDVFESRMIIPLTRNWRIGYQDSDNGAAPLQEMRNIVSDRHLALLKRFLGRTTNPAVGTGGLPTVSSFLSAPSTRSTVCHRLPISVSVVHKTGLVAFQWVTPHTCLDAEKTIEPLVSYLKQQRTALRGYSTFLHSLYHLDADSDRGRC